MNSEQLKALAQKAFALVTGVNPDEVTFKEGTLFHKCKWEHGDCSIEGNFYHHRHHDNNSGVVCITSELSDEEPFYRFPFSWHHLWDINTDSPIIV
ncbi:MAG: hypothetical protein M0P64_00470 [Candidatus Pacebacteria bacterium]|jgi:hypothetical protein|nr:hypothetical protein [Candidatus Paceibacterota bacterium]